MTTSLLEQLRAVVGADNVLTDGDLSGSSATVTIDANSIDTRNEQRDGHLRSNDFLAMDEFPEITFVSTGIKDVKGDEFTLVGDLTIKGITKPVELEAEFNGAATDPFGNARIGFSAETEVEREDWGLTWNAALETGGVLVSKKIKLVLDVSAIKQS